MILKILNTFKLNYLDFQPSYIEFCWDFYGDRYKNIRKRIWSKSNKFGFGYKDSTGKKRVDPTPDNIQQKCNPTYYLGEKYKSLQVKGYLNDKGPIPFNRVEVGVNRKMLLALEINNLDDSFSSNIG